MWKLAILLFIIGSSVAQDPLEISCQYISNVFGDYICRFTGIEVLDQNASVRIVGEHVEGRSNGDVNVVQIRNSNTPFIIQQIFTDFPNIVEIDITNSNLQELSLSPTVQLEYLTLYRNNMSRIVNGTFTGQSRLEFIEAMDNRIEVLEEGAFDGLENLFGLMMIGNRINGLSQRLLEPLANVLYLDFEQNRIERIEDGTFANNTLLEVLYLEFNQINAISPTFTQTLSPVLESVNLMGNRCVNRPFALREQIDTIILNNALNTCFTNFVGSVSERRRITLEFTGPLQLFDEFGNIIARVN